LENAVVVNNQERIANGGDPEQIFFGATVIYSDTEGTDTQIRIVGVDEVDLEKGYVSWISPIAKALIKAKVGDTVRIQTPAGVKEIDILDVRYEDC
jgi:transcription elongation factor GreB